MRKLYSPAIPIAPVFILWLLGSGCFKDTCQHSYKIFLPVYKKLSELRMAVKSQEPVPLHNTGKIYISGDRIYLNEKDKGIHIIDNRNPAAPKNIGFINIPGNRDLVIKDDILYADMYCDLAALDISNAASVSVKKYLTKTFTDRANYTLSNNADSIEILVDMISKDTVVDCETIKRWNNCYNCDIYFAAATSNSKAAQPGTGGSMARFAALGNHLYAVGTSDLNVIDITDAGNPLLVKKKNLNSQSETIYPFRNNLFIGTTTGMVVLALQNPADPQTVSWSDHWRSCDPVIADDHFAYVTLFDGATCGGGSLNQLDLYDISNLYRPVLVESFPMTNPHGLSKDGSLLFICDGRDGLKIYDATHPQAPKLIKHLLGTTAYDVIAMGGIAYLSAKEGLFQYDYNNPANIHLLSKLSW